MEKNTVLQKDIIEFLLGIILVLIGVGLRILPHPPNFTSITGIALFGGVYLSKRIAFFLPLAAMIMSDILLGFYELSLMISVYGSFILCVFVGFWLKKNKKWHRILGASVICSLLFFVITNFAVWAFTPWYSKTITGLLECYTMALPFFKNTLWGDLLYTVIFFGAYEIIGILIKKGFKLVREGSFYF